MDKVINYRKFIGDKSLLKENLEGKGKFLNPLCKIPSSDMRLYTVDDEVFFEKMDELLVYCRLCNKNTNELCVLDYYYFLAGKYNVIRIQNSEVSELYSMIDDNNYGIYNNDKSIYHGDYVWDICEGNMENMYNPFIQKGIELKNNLKVKKIS